MEPSAAYVSWVATNRTVVWSADKGGGTMANEGPYIDSMMERIVTDEIKDRMIFPL